MLGKFFRGSSESPKIPQGETKPEPSLAEREFKEILVETNPSSGRTIMHIPIELTRAAGGRDQIWKRIFPPLFGESYPAWGELHDDEYALEVPGDDPEKIEALKSAILAAARKG